MKTLKESLFDQDIATKDPFNDKGFKEWINRPDVLWYLYYYWEDGMADPFEDFMLEEWEAYKPLVDIVVEEINKAMRKDQWTWWLTNYDQYYDYKADGVFYDEDEFTDAVTDAIYEIRHMASEERDGIWKTWFKGPLPKNSNVTHLLQQCCKKFATPGKVNSGIFLTNEDTVIVMCFPRGINNNILKLFNLK